MDMTWKLGVDSHVTWFSGRTDQLPKRRARILRGGALCAYCVKHPPGAVLLCRCLRCMNIVQKARRVNLVCMNHALGFLYSRIIMLAATVTVERLPRLLITA